MNTPQYETYISMFQLHYKDYLRTEQKRIFTRQELEYLDIIGAISVSTSVCFLELSGRIIYITKIDGGFNVGGKRFKKIYNAIAYIDRMYGL